MIDTLRILVDWTCNLSCSYCCNLTPSIRQSIRQVYPDEIDWNKYKVFCITGGEPTIFPDRIQNICSRIPPNRLIVLYTNGTLLNPFLAQSLALWGVRAINIGLHYPKTFTRLIEKALGAVKGLGMSVRFHVQDIHAGFCSQYPDLSFRLWKMDDCDRPNEDRYILRMTD